MPLAETQRRSEGRKKMILCAFAPLREVFSLMPSGTPAEARQSRGSPPEEMLERCWGIIGGGKFEACRARTSADRFPEPGSFFVPGSPGTSKYRKRRRRPEFKACFGILQCQKSALGHFFVHGARNSERNHVMSSGNIPYFLFPVYAEKI